MLVSRVRARAAPTSSSAATAAIGSGSRPRTSTCCCCTGCGPGRRAPSAAADRRRSTGGRALDLAATAVDAGRAGAAGATCRRRRALRARPRALPRPARWSPRVAGRGARRSWRRRTADPEDAALLAALLRAEAAAAGAATALERYEGIARASPTGSASTPTRPPAAPPGAAGRRRPGADRGALRRRRAARSRGRPGRLRAAMASGRLTTVLGPGASARPGSRRCWRARRTCPACTSSSSSAWPRPTTWSPRSAPCSGCAAR